jgi:hypothetical protein
MDTTFEIIEKEAIETLKFPHEEVLTDAEKIKDRTDNLNKALSLGNLEHFKIKIYFEDNTKKRMVDTTVWGLTEERVILKQGLVIPIERIHKLEL